MAGVAWSPHVGIGQVEVKVDDGPWRKADLATELSIDTWRQWSYRWDAEPGDHRISVRAQDADGRQQSTSIVDPFPDGAEGLHSISLTVQ